MASIKTYPEVVAALTPAGDLRLPDQARKLLVGLAPLLLALRRPLEHTVAAAVVAALHLRLPNQTSELWSVRWGHIWTDPKMSPQVYSSHKSSPVDQHASHLAVHVHGLLGLLLRVQRLLAGGPAPRHVGHAVLALGVL